MCLVHAEIKPLLGKPPGDTANALHLIAVAPQARLVSNPLQLREIVGEPTFLVGLPKEPGVGKARPEDALVSFTDDARRILAGVDDGQELRREFSVLLFDSKILLMIAHHADEDFIR